MVRSLLIYFFLTATSYAGVNKCIVNGKTFYQSEPCPTEESVRSISNKSFTDGLSTQAIRNKIVSEKLEELEKLNRKKVDDHNAELMALESRMRDEMNMKEQQMKMRHQMEMHRMENQQRLMEAFPPPWKR